ncbi:MAG: nucleotidyltransferase domain-containing protein [Bacteroidales bacterium]|nr:nucleotidyltransferase domain-containing protein [Bacteroidales bacterium]MCQ2283888.1 nucleotidyltransferase domain-containing protein [Bacteroidales bacterium]
MINPQFKPYMPVVLRLLQTHKVKDAYLFGSVLTDRFNDNSDVDLLVNYDDDMDPLEMGESLMELYIELEDNLNRKIDLLTERSLKNPYFIKEINETKYQIYGD